MKKIGSARCRMRGTAAGYRRYPRYPGMCDTGYHVITFVIIIVIMLSFFLLSCYRLLLSLFLLSSYRVSYHFCCHVIISVIILTILYEIDPAYGISSWYRTMYLLFLLFLGRLGYLVTVASVFPSKFDSDSPIPTYLCVCVCVCVSALVRMCM